MSSQQYKDKLQQFYLENAEIKNATLEGENTSIRIAQHYRTLLELLRLLGIQEILEAGDTSTPGTVAKLLGGVSIADVFKVSSDIGLTEPNDPPQQVLTRLANGDIKLKPIEEFAAGSGLATDMNNLDGDLDDVETETILNKLGLTFSRLVNYFGDSWVSINSKMKLQLTNSFARITYREFGTESLPNTATSRAFEVSNSGIRVFDTIRDRRMPIDFSQFEQSYGMGRMANPDYDGVNTEPQFISVPAVDEDIIVDINKLGLYAEVANGRRAFVRYNSSNPPVFQRKLGSNFTVFTPDFIVNEFVPNEDCIVEILCVDIGTDLYKVWIWCDAYTGGSGGGSTTWGANEW